MPLSDARRGTQSIPPGHPRGVLLRTRLMGRSRCRPYRSVHVHIAESAGRKKNKFTALLPKLT